MLRMDSRQDNYNYAHLWEAKGYLSMQISQAVSVYLDNMAGGMNYAEGAQLISVTILTLKKCMH